MKFNIDIGQKLDTLSDHKYYWTLHTDEGIFVSSGSHVVESLAIEDAKAIARRYSKHKSETFEV